MSVHLVLLALSCAALAAAAAGGPLIGLTQDRRRAQHMAVLVSATLVAGNAVCLLPGTPAWYSAALVALTVGGLVWLLVSLVATRAQQRPTAGSAASPRRAPGHLVVVGGAARRDGAGAAIAGRTGAQLDAVRPRLAVLPGGRAASTVADPSAGPAKEGGMAAPSTANRTATRTAYPVVQATDVTFAESDGAPVAAGQGSRTLVTRRELDAMGPRGSRAQSVSVARGMRTYAPEAGRRRAQGSAFTARLHSADGAVLRAQLKALYADAPSPEPGTDRLRGTRA